MLYEVIVNDCHEFNVDTNELVFKFGDNYKEMMKFVDFVLKTTYYHVQILQHKFEQIEEENEEEKGD